MGKNEQIGTIEAVRQAGVTTADLRDAVLGIVQGIPGDPIQMPDAASGLEREFRAKIVGTARKILVAGGGSRSSDTAFKDAIEFEERAILFLAGRWSPKY